MEENRKKQEARERKNKNAIALCLYEILKQESDADHPLTSAEIIPLLAERYGIDANRNTVGRNLDTLRELGFPVSPREKSRNGAYIESRDFEPIELRWMTDSIRSSKFLTESYAEAICEKIEKLQSRHFRGSTQRGGTHNQNQQFSLSMEDIDRAIHEGKRVTFTYCAMDHDKKLYPISEPFEVIPLHIFLSGHQYYFLAHNIALDALRHYRLDRITGLRVLDGVHPEDGRIRKQYYLEGAVYTLEHPHMYGGTPVTVTLKMPRSLAGAVYDAFGRGAEMEPIDEIYMFVRVKAAEEGMRFFALQYGPNCEVIRPASLRAQVKADVEKMMETYR